VVHHEVESTPFVGRNGTLEPEDSVAYGEQQPLMLLTLLAFTAQDAKTGRATSFGPGRRWIETNFVQKLHRQVQVSKLRSIVSGVQSRLHCRVKIQRRGIKQ
jgi:hypothetical protein